jgi:hypothetical protein
MVKKSITLNVLAVITNKCMCPYLDMPQTCVLLYSNYIEMLKIANYLLVPHLGLSKIIYHTSVKTLTGRTNGLNKYKT